MILHTYKKWRVSGASVIGTSHTKSKTVCQDAWAAYRTQTVLSVCVCDGAGSAMFSDEGATLVSKFLTQLFADKFKFAFYRPKKFVRLAFSIAKNKLRKIAAGRSLREFACTVVLAAIHADGRWLTLHLGDGGIIARFDENKFRVISPPLKGEFANETVFITSFGASRCVNINRSGIRAKNLTGLALFSDGLERILYNHQTYEVALAVENMMTWQDKADEQRISGAIKQNITEVFRQKTDDDCSLIITTRKIL
ncbi:MAG: protein phosphatase 2C domain-containing protein [Planctomycetaceae bacterium]|jgi:serine/threonine protein phosphatase PrpC|nr:protein phosphatase 2C domain-containing protein [Planctomycetaceae bacterium]